MTEKMIVPTVVNHIPITVEELVKMEQVVKTWVNMTTINASVLVDMIHDCHPMLVLYLRGLLEANLVAQNTAMHASQTINRLFNEMLEKSKEDV